MANLNTWISAARPRTLPLALSSILMGCFLAAAHQQFSWVIAILACLTTILLQILSNFANDYGDAVNGKDTDARQGPARAVQSGQITAKAMKNAVILFSSLSFISGITLLYVSLKEADLQAIVSFLGIGILAIIAAITYTAGKKPYGYVGLGDLSVFIFFGWVGVLGVYYLHIKQLTLDLFLPATSCGMFAVGVLNLNNIRDIQSDTLTGKRSIPVRLGREKAVIYHWVLLITGMLCAVLYLIFQRTVTPLSSLKQALFLLSFPLFIRNGMAVFKHKEPTKLDPFLKQLALSTLLFVVLFGISHLF